MNLSDLSPPERKALAAKVGTNPLYLWQCATGRRSPSPAMARRLVESDARLTLHELRPDIWEAPEQS